MEGEYSGYLRNMSVEGEYSGYPRNMSVWKGNILDILGICLCGRGIFWIS